MKASIENLINILSVSKASSIDLVIEGPAKMNKRGNDLAKETVLKRTVGTFDFGGSYEDRVNEALKADGSTNTFTAKSLPFGKWVEGATGKVIVNEKPEGTKYYLRYYNGTVSEVSYTVNGKPATKEQIETIKQFTPVSSSSRSTQTDAGLSEEKQVRVQCVSFESIKELTIDGTTYELA